MNAPECPRCHNAVDLNNATPGYYAFCPECDEDFYRWEVI